MKTPDEKTGNCLINYLRGEASEEELSLLRKWLNESVQNKQTFDEIADIWTATGDISNIKFDTYEQYKNLRDKISHGESDKTSLKSNSNPIKINLYKIALQAAAVLIIGLLTTVLFLSVKLKSTTSTNNESVTEITAPLGSKSRVLLPDGTKVWLNAGSTLKYSNTFNVKNRTVSLEGEAFFDVVHKTDKPFLVKTTDVTIKVLGTAFNLKAYPAEGSIETTLVRGSLIVEQNNSTQKNEQTILAPKQRATFIKQTGKMLLSDIETQVIKQEKVNKPELLKGKVLVAKDIDTEIFTSWKDNKLVFRNETFESLTTKLERWYGVTINVTDKEIKNYHFNGTIENETINDVMDIIRLTLPIDFSISHNKITITKTK